MIHRERLRLRVAELDDEPRLDAMKPLAVVRTPPAPKLEEVLDVLRASAGKNSSVISPPFSSVITAVGGLTTGLSWPAPAR